MKIILLKGELFSKEEAQKLGQALGDGYVVVTAPGILDNILVYEV